jgi:hypothetical protein
LPEVTESSGVCPSTCPDKAGMASRVMMPWPVQQAPLSPASH